MSVWGAHTNFLCHGLSREIKKIRFIEEIGCQDFLGENEEKYGIRIWTQELKVDYGLEK
jgi:hypothetical protein